MSSSWWSVTALEPVPRQAKPSRLSLTQRRNWQTISSRLQASSWRDIMGCALQRIDESALPEGEPQPWRKQQQAKMKTAQKKANRKKAAMRKTTQKKSTMSDSDEASRREPEIQMEEDEKKGGQTRKRKRKGKERIPLTEEQPKEEHKKKDDNEGEKVVPYDGKCRKVRIFFSKQQKALIKRWMGTYRWTYNACNAAVRAGLCSSSVKELRARFLSSEAFGKVAKRKTRQTKSTKKKPKIVTPFTEEELRLWKQSLEPTGHFPSPSCDWVLQTPSDIRDQAIKELVQAYSNGKEAHGSLGAFQVKFKSNKRLAQQTITIGSREWNRKAKGNAHDSVYCQLFNRGKALCASESLPNIMKHDFKIVHTRLGRYYICMPTDLEVRSESQAPLSRLDDVGAECVFIDPGVRTFVTCFDLQGRVHEFGNGSIRRIERLCRHLDDLTSRTYAKRENDKHRFVLGKKKRWRMRRAALRMRRRIRNLVDEAHHKIGLWLLENYRVIVWPLSGVKNMVTKKKGSCKAKNNINNNNNDPHPPSPPKKQHDLSAGSQVETITPDEAQQRKAQLKERKRGINSKTVRAMLTWSWYRFQEWLKHKVREFPWCRLVLASEAHTTKTCTHCGCPNHHVGGSKVFRCADANCANQAADRDHQGARNIGVRFLTEWADLPGDD